MRRALRFIALTGILAFMAGATPLDCNAQNFWKRVTQKTQEQQPKKADKKNKKSTVTSPLELSLDENVLVPAVSAKEHESVSRHMKLLAKRLSDRKIERIETMRNAEVIVSTISTDLLFAPNDTIPLSKTRELLQPYTTLLQDNARKYKLVLALHTDDTGSEVYTDRLSESRVNAIYDILIGNSSDSELLIPYALGASDPRRPNDSRQGRASNRRLEIYIIPTSELIHLAKEHKL